MQKFEIINDKWIRIEAENNSSDTCKIESISRIQFNAFDEPIGNKKFAISLHPHGSHAMVIYYSPSEFELAKRDFDAIEKIFF